jgi:hypothetical protein
MTQSFDWSTEYATPRRPVFARNNETTSHPQAPHARMLMIEA